MGVQAPGSQQEPWGPYFGRFWSGLGSSLGDFASLLEGLRSPKAALEVPEPAGRGQEGAGSAQGWLRVGWGPDFGPNLGPTWPQLGSKN